MRVFAGFDCGGTSTRCMLVSEEGKILGLGKAGPANYLYCGKEMATESIRDSIHLAWKEAEEKGLSMDVSKQKIDGMFIASAAVEVFSGSGHAEFFREVTGCENVSCDSDIYPVWYGASKERFAPAICTIAGTGAVTYLLHDRVFVKASGWGPQIGDEGAGFDIGLRSLHLTTKMSDGRAPMDEEFYLAVLSHYGLTEDTCRRLWRAVNGKEEDYRTRVASVTRVIDGLASGGNQAAAEMFREAAKEVELCVRSVLRRSANTDPYDWHDNDSGLSFSLVLAGGLFREGSPLTIEVKKLLQDEPRIVNISLPRVPAVQSAASIALYEAGLKEAAEAVMEEGYE
ncbi:MAG: hypothetical protein IJM83_07115 [Firmicutes bacterium]|nr:hypothetical protein [Bacillota bacterium]